MGTSTSQPSPNNSNWKPAFACYREESIPAERVVNEIWRAVENQSDNVKTTLKSDAIYSCFNFVLNSENHFQALNNFNNYLIENKTNSIISEFAKRSIPIAFTSKQPANNWKKHFFAELTSYFVSRDVSGFVGKNYRNKTVGELIDFKKSISKNIVKKMEFDAKINSKQDWGKFVDKAISKLKEVE